MVLNLNWEIIWVFVNLLILFLLMKKFLFGPITKLLDERAKGVADTLDQAETQLAEAERQKAEYTQQLASARGEAAHIVEEARKRADLAYSRRMDEAAQDVQRLNEQAARQRAADREAMLASIPMGRLGQAEDVARAVAFFAGDGAAYITGQVLCVDGGMAV